MAEMNVWPVAKVDEQPSLTMVRWSIFETEIRTRHLVGFCLENNEGRVSSAIVKLDLATMRCRTFSGRVYQLEGPPGYDDDGAYVWECWTGLMDVPSWSDVTEAVLHAEKEGGGTEQH